MQHKLHRAVVAAVLAAPVLAQSNAVPGLDIRMYEVTDIAFQGRRGPAAPNGEAGFMIGHSWCNSGSVNLPWQSQSGGVMVDQYPRIAFLLVRESGGRMVQVSNRAYCKHSPTAFNFSSGPCAPCNVGSGSFFFVGCSDTYGSGTNSSQIQLGPTDEIDPWLGTWNPQGSYFDRGDPAVGGAAAIDSAKSLTWQQVQAFDSVKNRMIVRETELIPGAIYYTQAQGVVQGEPLSERDNNISNRACSITGTGGNWNASTTGSTQPGSVLTRWSGATVNLNGNGTDDGRFAVAVKVTGPTAGVWHYEYAIHNIDNNRRGASFRVPVAPGATVTNAGFRDLDTDPLNDWTFTHSGTEISFTAVGTNALEWNTIYNCWFDCTIPPGAGSMTIDQALPGPGAISVQVPSNVPSGLAFAQKEQVGGSCGTCTGTAYQYFPSATSFDLNGSSMTMTLANGAYSIGQSPVAFVPAAGTNLGLGLNGQATVNLPFSLPYPGGTTTQLRVHSSGYVSPGTPNAPQLSPSVAMLLQGTPRWAAAWTLLSPTAASPANVWADVDANRAILTWNGVPFLGSPTSSNTFQLQLWANGQVNVVWASLSSGAFAVLTGWSPGGNATDPGSRDLSATLGTPHQLCAVPFNGMNLDTNAMPVIGTTVQWQIGGLPVNAGWGALMRSLTQALPPVDLASIGMPGCEAHLIDPVPTFFAPAASVQLPESLPNNTALIGVKLIGQAVAFAPLNSLGLVTSNATVLTLGL